MSRIYGGIDEADLQNLIRETMQENLAQRDLATNVLSDRLCAVDERTRQGVEGVDERLEALVKRVQSKADSSALDSVVVGLEQTMQRKFEGVEWRSSAADDRINTLTQRLGQVTRDIERRDDDSRELCERLDDFSRRFQHKADSAYVDVRVGELRTQLQMKADTDTLDQWISELRQAHSDCKQMLAQKDEQLSMMMQQLAGKVEISSFNGVMEDLQEMSKTCQAGVMSTAQELTKLYATVQRFEELGVEERFRELTQLMQNVRQDAAESESRICIIERSKGGGDVDGGSFHMNLDQTIEGPTALVQAKMPSNVTSKGRYLDSNSPRALTNGPTRSSSYSAPPTNVAASQGAQVTVPVPEAKAWQRPQPGTPTSVDAASLLPPQTSPDSAKIMRTSQVQQIQSPQFTRSNSAPGLRRMSSGTSPVSLTTTPGQLAVTTTGQVSARSSTPSITHSPAPQMSSAPALHAAHGALVQNALPWTNQGGFVGRGTQR